MRENTAPEIDDQSLDAIREIINIGIGRAAGTLNSLAHAHVTLRVPGIRVIHSAELTATFPALISNYSIVTMDYSGGFTGTTALIFPRMSAVHLVALLSETSSDEPDITLVREETLKEVGNIIINAVMGSIGNVLKDHLSYQLPIYSENSMDHLLEGTNISSKSAVLVQTQFVIEEMTVEGKILLFLDIDSIRQIISRINEITPDDTSHPA